jgi:hypothetical protein
MRVLPLTAYQSKFLQELSAAGIGLLVIGGKALQAHGLRRETRDLDVLVSRSGDNPERLYALLARRLPHPNPKLSPEWLRLPRKLVSLPTTEDKEVDVLTWIDALDFDSVIERSIEVPVSNARVRGTGLAELVYLKLISFEANEHPETKARDLKDLQALMRLCTNDSSPA